MNTIIQKITPAIIASRKIKVQLANGKNMVVHPHIVVRQKQKQGDEILKSMLESGDCMDIPLQTIETISILPENFAIDTTCMNYDFAEYDLVFPRKADLFE
jgi:hypothetical protein